MSASFECCFNTRSIFCEKAIIECMFLVNFSVNLVHFGEKIVTFPIPYLYVIIAIPVPC